jgi:hypothetical protein
MLHAVSLFRRADSRTIFDTMRILVSAVSVVDIRASGSFIRGPRMAGTNDLLDHSQWAVGRLDVTSHLASALSCHMRLERLKSNPAVTTLFLESEFTCGLSNFRWDWSLDWTHWNGGTK